MIEQLKDIKAWLQHNATSLAGKHSTPKTSAGYRVIFDGAANTDKMLQAQLIGKEFNKEVYRVDLSKVVSKYIGETEKNLAEVFDKAQSKDRILFFDEADALFGKRTDVKDSHDKYANQEVSYLLQTLESYHGLAILATNLKGNIDDAFARRFHSIVHFPKP